MALQFTTTYRDGEIISIEDTTGQENGIKSSAGFDPVRYVIKRDAEGRAIGSDPVR